MYSIVTVIVTYNPDIQQINRTVQSIIQQISYCIIIDNGNTAFDFKDYENITAINLGKNYGIAYAQNRGIELAKKYNADFILLSDQDTVYPDNYIQRNVIAYEELKHRKLAALAPVFFNTIKKVKSPVMIKKFLSTTNLVQTYIKTAQVIASGTFILVNSLKEIGIMNEKLFIDYVDFEWCWRANALGYEIFTITDLIIHHQLGDDAKMVLGMNVTIRSDIRYYYMIRNACYLVRYSQYLKWYEKILFVRTIVIHIVGIFLLKRRIKSIKIVKSAILDGLLDRFK